MAKWPTIPVGFDYPRAILELRQRMSHDEIARYCGYESNASISKILAGAIPPHPQGEALWSLYVAVFNTRPPMSTDQASGTATTSLGKCAISSA